MPVVISVGSGKGGVGKSVITTNIGYLLAKSGLSVTLIDMDSGGADLHILMGLFKPRHTLTDFIEGRIKSLEEVAEKLVGFKGVRIIAGTGDSLHTANMPAATKGKVLRHIRLIKSDVVIIDIGAGTHFNTLDFFNAANIHVGVTSGDPTAIHGLYRFMKLAVIRKALSSFRAHDELSKIIRKKDVKDIDELLAVAAEHGADKKQAINDSIAEIHPFIVFNQVEQSTKARFNRLRTLLQPYFKITELELLGRIPEDQELRKSVRTYHPVSSLNPAAPSAHAFETICLRILKQVERLQASKPQAGLKPIKLEQRTT